MRLFVVTLVSSVLGEFLSGSDLGSDFELPSCEGNNQCIKNDDGCNPETDSDCALVSWSINGRQVDLTLVNRRVLNTTVIMKQLEM